MDDKKIDITLRRVCTTCQTEEPMHFCDDLQIMGENTTLEMRVDPDEFSLCAVCGNPMRLRIQAQPYELVHHLDTPVAQAMYEWERRQEHKSHTIETRKTDDGQFEAIVQELGVTVTGATEKEALNEVLRGIQLRMSEEAERQKREAEQREGKQ